MIETKNDVVCIQVLCLLYNTLLCQVRGLCLLCLTKPFHSLLHLSDPEVRSPSQLQAQYLWVTENEIFQWRFHVDVCTPVLPVRSMMKMPPKVWEILWRGDFCFSWFRLFCCYCFCHIVLSEKTGLCQNLPVFMLSEIFRMSVLVVKNIPCKLSDHAVRTITMCMINLLCLHAGVLSTSVPVSAGACSYCDVDWGTRWHPGIVMTQKMKQKSFLVFVCPWSKLFILHPFYTTSDREKVCLITCKKERMFWRWFQ